MSSPSVLGFLKGLVGAPSAGTARSVPSFAPSRRESAPGGAKGPKNSFHGAFRRVAGRDGRPSSSDAPRRASTSRKAASSSSSAQSAHRGENDAQPRRTLSPRQREAAERIAALTAAGSLRREELEAMDPERFGELEAWVLDGAGGAFPPYEETLSGEGETELPLDEMMEEVLALLATIAPEEATEGAPLSARSLGLEGVDVETLHAFRDALREGLHAVLAGRDTGGEAGAGGEGEGLANQTSGTKGAAVEAKALLEALGAANPGERAPGQTLEREQIEALLRQAAESAGIELDGEAMEAMPEALLRRFAVASLEAEEAPAPDRLLARLAETVRQRIEKAASRTQAAAQSATESAGEGKPSPSPEADASRLLDAAGRENGEEEATVWAKGESPSAGTAEGDATVSAAEEGAAASDAAGSTGAPAAGESGMRAHRETEGPDLAEAASAGNEEKPQGLPAPSENEAATGDEEGDARADADASAEGKAEGGVDAEAAEAEFVLPAAGSAAAPAAAETGTPLPAEALAEVDLAAAGPVTQDAPAPGGLEIPEAPEEPRMLENIERVEQAMRLAVRRRITQVSIRLDPPELGRVQIEMEIRNGALHATLRAESAEARGALLQNVEQLRENLGVQGIDLDGFDVNVGQEETPRSWQEQTGGRFGSAEREGGREEGRSGKRGTPAAAPAAETASAAESGGASFDGALNLIA